MVYIWTQSLFRFFLLDSLINRLVYIQGRNRLRLLLDIIIVIEKRKRKNRTVFIHRYYLLTLKIGNEESSGHEFKVYQTSNNTHHR